jgi:hypothetical protein
MVNPPFVYTDIRNTDAICPRIAVSDSVPEIMGKENKETIKDFAD